MSLARRSSGSYNTPISTTQAHISTNAQAILVSKKFINCLMKSGNQNVAENVLAKASALIKIKLGATAQSNTKRNDFIPFLYEAIRNVKPLVELNTQSGGSGRSRRQKPKAIPMSSRRGEKLAIQ